MPAGSPALVDALASDFAAAVACLVTPPIFWTNDAPVAFFLTGAIPDRPTLF
jgi:hypothetical protein